ncbi:MAG TPA: NUDIX domain-containing protein [Thermoplasmata archaeon]|nr:NUDIX domain-containing protein [Thermoplasmata archaeon]
MTDPPEAIAQECVEGYLFRRAPLELLVLRRPPSRGSIWVPVSGKVDPGDRDLPSALLRELAEETGLADPRSVVDLDWHVTFPGPDGRPWRLHGYAVEVPADFSPRLSPEHEAFAWVTEAEALRRLHYDDNRDAVRRLVALLGPDDRSGRRNA